MQLELRSVRIKNCGPIDDIKLDFFDAAGKTLPVCVIGGANGSGKTTILEAITYLALTLELWKKTPSKSSLFSKPDTYIQTDWRFGDLELSLFRGKIPKDADLHSEHYGQALREEEDASLWWGEFEVTPRVEPFIYYWMSEAKWVYPSLIYLPHNRSLEPVAGQEIRKEEDLHRFVHRFQTVRQFPGSLTSYLIWLDYAEPEHYAQTQQFLNDLDFDGKTFRVDRKTLSVVVKTASGEEHPLHELSSGEQNILIILIELRRKLSAGSVVLIDEIENSLHPAYQHRLAQGLLALQRETPYQLIVTTHAPAFVEIFGAENTRLLTAF